MSLYRMNFLQIIKENMSEVDNRGVVKVNYKALNKLLEEHTRLLNYHKGINNGHFTLEDEDLESYGNEMMTVNYKAVSKLVEEYEKFLELIKIIRN